MGTLASGTGWMFEQAIMAAVCGRIDGWWNPNFHRWMIRRGRALCLGLQTQGSLELHTAVPRIFLP
jgi:hypothetical protein